MFNLVEEAMPKETTYTQSFQAYSVKAIPHRISTKGRLASEGIFPVPLTRVYGIDCTRFLSKTDIRLAALALYALNLSLFNDNPLTSKEQRLVRGIAYQMGLIIQYGGFLGKLRCLVVKGEPFEQAAYTLKGVHLIVADKKINYTSLWRNSGTVCTTPTYRIDIQDPTPTHQNLQVQVNKSRKKKAGKKESTSVATVLIDNQLSFFVNDTAHQRHVVRKVRHAFLLSAQTGVKYEVRLGAP